MINKFYTFLYFYPSYTEVYSDDSIVFRPAETEVVEEVESFSYLGFMQGWRESFPSGERFPAYSGIGGSP